MVDLRFKFLVALVFCLVECSPDKVEHTETGHQITIQLNEVKTSGKITRRTISGTSTMARNLVGTQPQVNVKENVLEQEKV